MTCNSYESLGSFYLGREVDPETGADRPDLLLYDSRDLTTHAVCVGMTGSGKTGLCLSLLEEAAIDGIPAIAIDPKGDIGNLLLTFPALRPDDFAPWVDEGEAARQGMSREALAARTADAWRKGLADWQQDGERIRRLRSAVDMAIYTPGSTAGRGLSLLRSFDAPAAAVRADADALAEHIGATVGALMGLLGIQADPVHSREHILVSNVLHHAWRVGRSLDLAGLIQAIQRPDFDWIGVLDLETFYPAKERLQLALRLNNLLAAPELAAWMSGEPIDVQRLLYTPEGKPRISIVSIAHLNDAQRMFVVTLLLTEVVAWMRRQTGTSSLRAVLYMDEIFGFFPPSAMPPSKRPLLTLMKQARAFGLGVVLATQNPVDLDYKGLANAGTWLIGRLQTERDKARVIEGLASNGAGLNKSELESLLSKLGTRVFLMRNVHEDAPVLFRTRWALSYLRGPLTLAEIARLEPPASRAAEPARDSTHTDALTPSSASTSRPILPANINEYFARASRDDALLLPRVLATVRLHFADKRLGVDVWQTRRYVAAFDENDDADWNEADEQPDLELERTAPTQARYAQAPASALRAQSYAAWGKRLAAHAYAHASLRLWRCALANAVSAPDESEDAFRSRMALALREQRDTAMETLRRTYAPRLKTLEDQLRRAEDRVRRERDQLAERKMQTAFSVGTSILGALLGRKKLSASQVGRLGTAARSAGRIGRERADVAHAEESLEVLQQRRLDLEQDFERQTAQLRAKFDPATAEIETLSIRPRKSDIDVAEVALLWVAA